MQDASSRAVDLRRYQRIVVPDGMGIRVSGQNGGRALEGIATVISVGGMFCRTNDREPSGTVLTLTLNCPSTSIRVQGNVRHANEQGIGIEFVGLTGENREKLESLLHQLRPEL